MSTRQPILALLAIVALPGVAAAQGFAVLVQGRAGSSCTARALGAQPFVESKSMPDFDPFDPVGVSGQAGVQCSRQGDPGVMADSDASSNYSGTIAGAGSDVFGNTLASSITIQVGGNANANATGDVVEGGVGSSALSSAGVVAGFGVLPGTMITVQVNPAGTFDSVTLRGGGALPADLSGGFSGAATEGSGGIEVEFIGSAGARTNPPGAPTFTGNITATVTFGAKPAQGACCLAPGVCSDEELQADCTGTFLGDQTQCSMGGCSAGGPTPTPTATPPPTTVFTWTNPSGGPYATVANWSPPEEPGSVSGRDDTALFDLGGTYGVDVAGARAARFVIRNGSVDLAGGTAQVTGSSLAAPSLTIGTNGVFNVVSGIFTAVDVGIGEDPTGLAAAAILDPAAVWTASGRFTIGRANEGLLTITAGRLTSAESRIGGGPARGDAIVGGDFARWETANLGLGFGGADGTLEVRDGGRVVSNDVVIGVEDGPRSLVTVTGSAGQASSWKVHFLEIGAASPGLLEVLAGGRVDFDGITLGNGLLGSGSARVAGPSSVVGATGSLLTVGRIEGGDLVVEDGGLAEAETIFIGGGATGTVEVRGVGTGTGTASHLRASEELSVGVNAPGTLRVTDRAKASSGNFVSLGGASAAESGTIEILTGAELTAASVAAAHGNFVVDGVAAGTPSTAIVFGDVTIEGDATLEVRSGALLTAGKLIVDGIGDVVGLFPPATRSRLTALELVCGDTAPAFFRIRDGAFAESIDATIGRNDGCDAFIFGNPTPGAVDWAIQRDLTIGFAGGLHFCPGPGLVTVGRQLTIEPNGVVEGNGTVRAAIVNGGVGNLGCSIGTLVVEGDYRQTASGRLVVEAAAPGDVDVLRVTGATVLDGTLEVHFTDGYLPAAGDFLPFLDLEGSVTGAFQRVTVAGVDEELVLAPAVVGGVAGLTALSNATACDGDCERCDNCVDDDGNGLVDRVDPDCAAAADGAGAGIGGDTAARKAAGKCAATMAAAGAKLSARVMKGLQKCTDAVLACVQTKPGDAGCIAKANATCRKATAGLAPDGTHRRRARLAIAKACGSVPLATLGAATGLGFDAEVARCTALATPVLASVEDVVACIDRATVCRASALFATRVPRALELLAAGAAEASLLVCIPTGTGDGGALGDPKTLGKPLAKCQKAIAAAGAKLTAKLAKGYGACAAAMRACAQSADPAACLTKAEATCAKATRTLPTVTSAADAKLLAALTKACGALDAAALLDPDGLGFGATGARCAALGVPALDGPSALATCLSREQACGAAMLVEAATPRLREHLGRAGISLE